MANKYEETLALYEYCASLLTRDVSRYTYFLDVMANNYKYTFTDQVLISAQKPDATACASYEFWNKNMHRYVNRGAKGIALLSQGENINRVHYVFDVSDTNAKSAKVQLWKYDERFEDDITESLINAFGESTDILENFNALIKATSLNAVNDNYIDYFAKFTDAKDFTDTNSEKESEKMFIEAVHKSVQYVVLKRIGADVNTLFSEQYMSFTEEFKSIKEIAALGGAVSDISEMLLRNIERTLKSKQREESLAKHNTLRENQIKGENENGREDGNHLQTGGRLSSSEHQIIGGGQDTYRQIRDEEARIHETVRETDVQRNDNRGNVTSLSGGAEQTGNRDGRKIDSADGSERGSERGDAQNRPNEVGRTDEQLQTLSAGNSNERADTEQSVSDNEERPYYDRRTENRKLLTFQSDEDIKELLTTAPRLKASKEEIANFFSIHSSGEERNEFIKSIFNDERTELEINGKHLGYKTYQNVLHIWEGEYDNRIGETHYQWGVITNYFEGMFIMGELTEGNLIPSEAAQLSFIEQAEEEKSSAFVFPQALIDYVLQGKGYENGRYRIYEQYQKQLSAKENIAFLKDLYGMGGVSPLIIGTKISEMHDAKGIELYSRKNDEKKLLDWAYVEKRIRELINLDRYLLDHDKEGYSAYLQHNEEARLQKSDEAEVKAWKDDEVVSVTTNTEGIEEEKADPIWQAYQNAKKEYPFSVTAIKVGDFYEFLANDALSVSKEIELTVTKRSIEGLSEKTDMCGIPSFSFEKSMNKLTEAGYDIAIVDSLDVEVINNYKAFSDKEIAEEKDEYVVGRIDHLNTTESIGYLYEEEFVSAAKEAAHNGVPFNLTIYRDRNGNTIDTSFMDELDTPPKNFAIEDLPVPTEEQTEPHSAVEEKEAQANGKEESDSSIYGRKLTVEGREYIIEDIDYQNDSVRLIDVTFYNGVGFPIARVEHLTTVERWLKEEKKQKPVTKIDFQITDDNLGAGGKKEKYRLNIDAIKLLNTIEAENRLATKEEQEVLSKYVGWGGLAEAFDESNSSWASEYTLLKSLLSEKEYIAARASTLTSYFTAPTVIKAIYKAVSDMGFKTGNILEPSCGVGNFFGLLPDTMQESKLYGVELDSITGRIAKQLYQNADIKIQGYEESELPDSFFDLAIGNVPFGSYKLNDRKYDKHNFLIHDYFFAKTLDKVRPGGVVAFVTSKGTMDKANPQIRKYIAERAELIGAIRLPNTAFKSNAGTEVTSDILFLKKRDRAITVNPEWIYLGKTDDDLTVNSYFIEHPEMVLGELKLEKGLYGSEDVICVPHEDRTLEEELLQAVSLLEGKYEEAEISEDIEETDLNETIPADPDVKNYSYTLYEGKVYFRENSIMKKCATSVTANNRIKGLIELRDCVRTLIDYQVQDYSDEAIENKQHELNTLYDSFTKKYGLIRSRGNSIAFSDDSSYFLLCSLEELDEEGNLKRKADIFTKRTIKFKPTVTKADTPSEALAISLSEKAKVDIPFISTLCGKDEQTVIDELYGLIFKLPSSSGSNIYVSADEYLSGNIREKLDYAIFEARQDSLFEINIKALREVLPKDLAASEIDVRLGATWVPPKFIEDFMFELLETPRYLQYNIKVNFSEPTGEWYIKGKSADRYDNIKANMTYGTKRINAYKIIESTLNLKDVRIYDKAIDANGNEKRVLNKKETAIASQKQEAIKEAFKSWIFRDSERREQLVRLYNDKFNSIRPREYDGSHLTFNGINPEIKLREHQQNGVARIIYGGNSLLAHCVGAGKTYTMAAAAMESKRLGLCSKSMFVVPNHLTEQFASEFMSLYPSANILVTTKKDFETKNRKRFCARIATGDYDAIVIGHSQFEKIPISRERQIRQTQEQIQEIAYGIIDAKAANAERFSIKQLEKTKRNLENRIEKLKADYKKDDVVTFEELGIDRLFVDEADTYKNLFLYTKMRNVAGLSQTDAQKSSDMFAKTQYMDELTGGKGVIFATGTPISNSITEMYTMQRYLQNSLLKKMNFHNFDSWASTFGETVSAIELAPEGTGYRAKTRFARFYNLPELVNMFREVADIQTADMLQLPVPEAQFHNISVQPSQFQKDMVANLAERAEKIRNRQVQPNVDNMLKVTNDGRKLALDQRLENEMLPDDESSKVNACVQAVNEVYKSGNEEMLTQLIFCDMSTPHNDGHFNVYDDIKRKLIACGIPEKEIAYIHDANTDTRKKELFAKVRSGSVRVLIGSTFKMGAGTNIQTKLKAIHHLDCPWRPRDIEQRNGRIIRQGNDNAEVDVYTYVTEQTFDAYLYQILENKQKFISQIMTSKSPVRSAEDIDEASLSYAEVKALATGNPLIKEKMDLDIQVSKLKLLKANYLSDKYALEDKIYKSFPREIKLSKERIEAYKADIDLYNKNLPQPTKENDSPFAGMEVNGIFFAAKQDAGGAIIEMCKKYTSTNTKEFGSYMGFKMYLSYSHMERSFELTLTNNASYIMTIGSSAIGNITRINNALVEIPQKLEQTELHLETLTNQLETAKAGLDVPFEKEDELNEKTERLNELNSLLNVDEKEPVISDEIENDTDEIDINEQEEEYER